MERKTGFPTKKSNVIPIQPLDKKVPKNPKYEDIGPVVKTGKTIKQVEVLSNQSVAKRKGEIFHRIKGSTLAKLLQEVGPSESIYQMSKPEDLKEEDNKSVFSIAHSVAASEISVITVNTEALGLSENSEFVLLDLREENEFEQFHIKEAISFPAPNITRDRILPQVFRLKNQQDKFIIVYAFDERPGVEAARKFAEKGFENVFLLSGGIEEFCKNFPNLVEGNPPVLENEKMKKTSGFRKSGSLK
jgi:centrosomal protein CEP41